MKLSHNIMMCWTDGQRWLELDSQIYTNCRLSPTPLCRLVSGFFFCLFFFSFLLITAESTDVAVLRGAEIETGYRMCFVCVCVCEKADVERS